MMKNLVVSVNNQVNPTKITGKILNSLIDFVFDTGASVNVPGQSTYEILVKKS